VSFCNFCFCVGSFFRGRKDKRKERSRDRKDRSTSRKRSRKDEDRIKAKAKPRKVTKGTLWNASEIKLLAGTDSSGPNGRIKS